MPISHNAWCRSLDKDAIRAAFDREEKRWNALSPEQRKIEQDRIDARQERARKHIEWLDWCVANKVHPNLASGKR